MAPHQAKQETTITIAITVTWAILRILFQYTVHIPCCSD